MDNSRSRRPGPPPGPHSEPASEPASDPDPEWTEYLAWQDREAAGRDPDPELDPGPETHPEPDPEPWPPDIEEPRDTGAEVPPRFWQGEAADELPPSPLLAGLDQCNLAPRCRTHHRAKQAPDWTVEQLAPGVTRWTLPSGRRHITTPTRHDS
jgi:hypothetical protein